MRDEKGKMDNMKTKIMKNLSSFNSHFSLQKGNALSLSKGFTLIELLIVISITGILGALGIAGFTTFNQIQVLQSSANDLATVLNVAKSRAQSQVKLGALCRVPAQILEGYRVDISTPKSYTLSSVCSNTPSVIEAKTLPAVIIFNASTSFFFPVITGGVQGSGQAVISGYGRNKIVKVDSSGGISIQ